MSVNAMLCFQFIIVSDNHLRIVNERGEPIGPPSSSNDFWTTMTQPYSVKFGSASMSSGANSPFRYFSRATTAIIAALSVHAFRGGTVTRIP